MGCHDHAHAAGASTRSMRYFPATTCSLATGGTEFDVTDPSRSENRIRELTTGWTDGVSASSAQPMRFGVAAPGSLETSVRARQISATFHPDAAACIEDLVVQSRTNSYIEPARSPVRTARLPAALLPTEKCIRERRILGQPITARDHPSRGSPRPRGRAVPGPLQRHTPLGFRGTCRGPGAEREASYQVRNHRSRSLSSRRLSRGVRRQNNALLNLARS